MLSILGGEPELFCVAHRTICIHISAVQLFTMQSSSRHTHASFMQSLDVSVVAAAIQFSWHSRVSVSLSTQQAGLNPCAKSCPGFSSRFVCLVRNGRCQCAHALPVIDRIGVFLGTLRRQTLPACHIHRYTDSP